MRQNDPSSTSAPSTTLDQRPPFHATAWVWAGALVVLMILTSLAVASVSLWLVVPYLILMALTLFAPTGWRVRSRNIGEGSTSRSAEGEELADEQPGAGLDEQVVTSIEDAPAAETEPVADFAEATASEAGARGVKIRRGKVRMRKAKGTAESPGATATWIQVGPGKFVRVENPGAPVVAVSSAPEGASESESALLIPGEETGEPDDSLGLSSGTAGEPEDATPSAGQDAVAEVSLGEAEASFVPADAEDDAVSDEPALDEPVTVDAGGNLEQTLGPEQTTASDPAEAVVLEAPADVDAPPPADVDAPSVASQSASASEVEAFRDAEDQEPGDVVGAVVAGAILASTPELDADSEDDHGAVVVVDAARDNGIAPDAFAETTGDNGIAPDAFVDVPAIVARIGPEEASPLDQGANPPVPAETGERPHRATLGVFPSSSPGRWPHLHLPSGRVPQRRARPFGASPGRLLRSSRRIQGSPGLRRPSRRATVRSRQTCRTFPPRSPPLAHGAARLDCEPMMLCSRGTILDAPSGKHREDAGIVPLAHFLMNPGATPWCSTPILLADSESFRIIAQARQTSEDPTLSSGSGDR